MKLYTGPARPIPVRVRLRVSRILPCAIYMACIVVLLLDIFYWRS
jgi:hypothetical protein